MPTIKGNADGKDLRIGIVVSRWNEPITSELTNGALRALSVCGVEDSMITIVEVPGAFEIPIMVDRMCTIGQFDAVIALGCVIKGETAHFEYVSNAAMEGIREVSLRHHMPITCGVLTTYTYEQAAERARRDDNNKGSEAALTAVEMVNVLRLFEKQRPRKNIGY